MKDFRFSLDIGTRKIAAFITVKENDNLTVLHSSILPHKNRAVRAGQIHDIDTVAACVKELKDAFEKNFGFEIKKTGTAIAGRNLKTFRSSASIRFDSPKEISENDMQKAELEAIQSVLSGFGDDMESYYFAGHTRVKWEIDGDFISHPLGHFAKDLKVEIITTFLPKRVLESLFTVLKKSELEMSYLTLEPIAACESVLPSNMKHIPIILIDIGAGTSDIAMISKGSVQAFGMIPMAGDFITESLSSELIIDFNEAERVKTASSALLKQNPNLQETTVQYKDIFQREQSRNLNDISAKLRPYVAQLSKEIALEIQRSEFTNTQQNYAVVLVGGGALTPFLDSELAAALSIPVERIGVRTPRMSDRFVLNPSENPDVLGPQSAVALGIANLNHEYTAVNLLHITVNDRKVELLNFSDANSTVLSALLASGLSKNDIYGKPGLAKTFTLNGEVKVVKGQMPVPSKVKVDDADSELHCVLKEGSKIVFSPAVNGQDAVISVPELINDSEEFVFTSNGAEKPVKFPLKIIRNNAEFSPETMTIEDRDILTINTDYSLPSVLKAAGIDFYALSQNSIAVNVLGDTVRKTVKNHLLLINGDLITDTSSLADITLKPGDKLAFESVKPVVKVGDFIKAPAGGNPLKVKINGEEFIFPGSYGKLILNGREVEEDAEVNDGDIIRTVRGMDAEAALVDIFKYISLEPKDTVGKRLKLFVNQREAGFTTPLNEGAEVTINFE